MHSVTVYGFGTAFRKNDDPNDIDFLIVHDSNDPASCRVAIQCKQLLAGCVARAHVTMLSKSEEAYFRFIETTKATALGRLHENSLNRDFQMLIGQVKKIISDA